MLYVYNLFNSLLVLFEIRLLEVSEETTSTLYQ